MSSIKFNPSFCLKNPHIQTLYATFFRKDKLQNVVEEEFTLSDGDFVEIVWNEAKPKLNQPIVVLFHGLAGSVKSPYIIGQMIALKRAGYAVALMHFRGCGKRDNLLPQAYHSGKTDDAKEFIEYLHTTYPKSKIYAVGFSIGGNMLLKLLGEWGSNSLISKAVSISAPLRLDICADTIEKGIAQIYQNYLLKPLKTTLIKKYNTFDMQQILSVDKEHISKIKTIREFDDTYVAPIFGFKSSQDYYKQSSAKQYLKDIRVPTLIIQAKDDPFMTPEILPTPQELSSYIKLIVTKHGGHVGFINGSFFKPKYWLDRVVIDFIK